MYLVRSFDKIVATAVLVLLLSLVNTLPAFAQQYLGTLTGEVTDASGAKIANADVSATDVTTHFTTFSKHTLRVGFDGNLSRYNVQNPQSDVGTFNFNRQFT